MTQEITIRPYATDDAPLLFDAVRESVREVGAWMAWCTEEYSLADAEGYIEAVIAGAHDGTMYDFAIFCDDEFAGACGINHINTVDRFANMGYWVRTSQAGRGVAVAATRQLVNWSFDNTDLNRIEIVAAVGNVASQRVAEKLGAVREGILAKRTIVNGAPTSAVLYSIVRPD